MVRAIFSLVFFLAFEGLSLGVAQGPADAEKALSRRVGACHIEQFGAYHALADISQKTGVPIGVDAVQPEKEIPVAFDFPGGTVAELLDTFVPRLRNTNGSSPRAAQFASRAPAPTFRYWMLSFIIPEPT